MTVNRMIARLIDCGMTRDVALFMYGKYKRAGELDSDTDFARAVDGREQNEVLPIIDELMRTLQILYPRLYNAVMVKLS